jgi:prevent-host-death family protein
MRVIQASEAKAKFLSLLDDVEKGETLVITRHGKPIARIVPDEDEARRQRIEAFQTISEMRKQTLPISLEELLSSRHEGHKY